MMERRRSTARHFRPTGVGSFTANSSHPFNERFFDDLDRRLAQEPPPVAPLRFRVGDVAAFHPASHPLATSPVHP